MKNVLEFLEKTEKKFGNKTAFAGAETSLSFTELLNLSRKAGTFLIKNSDPDRDYGGRILVYMDKTPECISAFLGVVYGGFAYVPAGTEMPEARINSMIETAGIFCIITDKKNYGSLKNVNIPVYLFDDIITDEPDKELLAKVRNRQREDDLLYVMFTSGSTGTPKGVRITHKGVMAYIESLSELLSADSENIYANQAPFYSDASLKEIYLSLRNGSTVYIVPGQLFLFPVRMIEYLNEKKINTLCWVSSALAFVSALGGFEKAKPEYVHTVTFVGEVFPVKQLNIWRKNLPDATFYNLYGPTEVTGVCCGYEIKKEREPFDESLPVPIGKPLKHSKIWLLDETGRNAKEGEICVESISLSPGYINNEEKTKEVFTDNPANPGNRIYRTGDIGRYDEEGNLVFSSRKDYQIKHMGYRIELSEIEAVAHKLNEITEVCCVYNEEKKKIVMYYSGSAEEDGLKKTLKEFLPRYMMPGKYVYAERLPKNGTGKIDRKKLYDIEKDGGRLSW